jgi:16S rRNA (adenine1518-N6/adenine1519-N6)-dimethyltransferase
MQGSNPGRPGSTRSLIFPPRLVIFIEFVVHQSLLPMITPRKSLGQNFLRDKNISRKIVEALHLQPGDTIIEIGPGEGALTELLVEQADRLAVIEIDGRAVELLRDRFGPTLRILHKDVLGVSIASLSKELGPPIRILGNIPYNITSDLLFWLIDQRRDFADATLMMQREVAQRLVAQPGTKEYGILSVMTQLYLPPQLLFRVSPGSFYPRPSVESAVVRLDARRPVPEHPADLLRVIVRGTFGKRRKTLMNGLRYLGFTGESLRKCPIDLQRRPDDLTLEEFLQLARSLEGGELQLHPNAQAWLNSNHTLREKRDRNGS